MVSARGREERRGERGGTREREKRTDIVCDEGLHPFVDFGRLLAIAYLTVIVVQPTAHISHESKREEEDSPRNRVTENSVSTIPVSSYLGQPLAILIRAIAHKTHQGRSV